MRGALPIRSSAVRRTPQACTSADPKLETPTSVTHSGLSVTARISSSFAGHSSIAQRFQSSGKPCTATTSISSRAPLASRRRMKEGSMGDIPPRTRGNPAFSAAIACPARRVICANRSQFGSSWGSQCDLLFGSFQIFAASITPVLVVLGSLGSLAVGLRSPRVDGGARLIPLSGAADVDLRLRVFDELEAGAAQHRLRTGRVRRPPVGPVAGVLVLDEVQLRVAGILEVILLEEAVVGPPLHHRRRAALERL